MTRFTTEPKWVVVDEETDEIVEWFDTEEEALAGAAARQAAEAAAVRWFYLSFADDAGFIGACVVAVVKSDPVLREPLHAKDRWFARAHAKSWALGINPGDCSVAGHEVTHAIDRVPERDRSRLLTRAEVEAWQ